MNSNDPIVLSEARLSPERMPRAPPISLSVRDSNVIRPPQRTSSLKPSPTVRNDRKKPSQVSESRPNKQSKTTKPHYKPFTGSLLKVAKTRLNTESALTPHSKENVFGRLHNASIHSLISEDMDWWKGSDLDISHRDNVKSVESNVSAKTNPRRNVDSECSSVSRPSTALSHSTTTSISRQPHYCRESVRRVVTKAFSTLNRKKRNGPSDRTKSVPNAETASPTFVSDPSAHCAKYDCVRVESHDFGVHIMGNEKYPPSVVGAHDVEGSRTAPPPSFEARDHSSNKRTPPNVCFTSATGAEDFRKSSESLFSQPGYQEGPSPQAGDRRLVDQRRDELTTLRVRLAAKAELKEANLTSEEAIWAMVQVHGEIFETLPRFFNSDVKASIAIAIILDNSCLSTMKDIEKAILEIIGLAGRLQAHVDRLGIFCTAFSRSSLNAGADCCVFSLFQPLDREQLPNRLKLIAKQSQHGYYLETALSQAAQALHALGEAQTPAIRRDIIVMSPNPVGLGTYTQMLDTSFSVHLFNPGLVPFGILDPPCLKSQLDPATSGMSQQYETLTPEQDLSFAGDVPFVGWVIDATTCISKGCSIHGSHSLHDVVAHSKAQANTGSIRNISISITPGADVSSIEEIAGKLDYSSLLPGQMISIPIKVRLRSLAFRLLCIPSPQSPHRSVIEAITDLELTLGEHLSELFRVQVQYSHSMFPENTTLVAQESCWLRRTLKPRKARGNDSRRESVFECVVQRQLALSLAGLGPPTDALHALEMEFDGKPVPIYCSKFVEAVKHRLRHRILQSPARPSPNLAAETDLYEAELQEFVDEGQRHEPDTDDSPATVVRRRIAPTPDTELHDTARRIWQHIRKTSKPERDICDEIEPDLGRAQESDARMEEIRRMALRNRRKMSTETLKSLARDYTRFSSELVGVDELGDDVD